MSTSAGELMGESPGGKGEGKKLKTVTASIGAKKNYNSGKTVDSAHKRIEDLATHIDKIHQAQDGKPNLLKGGFRTLTVGFDKMKTKVLRTIQDTVNQLANIMTKTQASANKPPAVENLPPTDNVVANDPEPEPRLELAEDNRHKGNEKQRPYDYEPYPDSDALPYAMPPINRTNQERLPDGKLNLQRTNVYSEPSTRQEERVKWIWPEAVLPSEAAGFAKGESNNIVVIPANLRLVWADNSVLDKLGEIQNRLKIALVPYELWATRMSIELAGDFQQVAIFLRSWNPSWVTFLEAVIQVLEEHHVLHSPLVVFATLLRYQDESIVNFTRRIREAYYKLPMCSRETHQNREILINLLRTYTPSVWMTLQDHIRPLATGQAVEEAVRRAALVTQAAVGARIYGTPAATVQLQGTAAPSYNMWITDATPVAPGVASLKGDHQVNKTSEDTGYAAKVEDNECFNCGKKGHWAKDYRQRPKFPRKTTPNSEKVSINDRVFKEKDNDRQKFGKKTKAAYVKWKNRSDKRFHFTEYEDNDKEEQDGQSPAEAISEYDVDAQLAAIFDTLNDEEE
ncbi:hypothetical protein F4804DRAFT_329839 [Jackrogersella minutella]|nr:hypothetical protein F4804DRAFT_329839 [Jackrogersella minutella]